MLTRQLGRTGLKVTTLCLGGNVFDWTLDEKGSFDVLDAYLEMGGNFIDTADAYSRWVPGHKGGESETVLGNWLSARGSRHSLVLLTKLFVPTGPGPNDRGLSRAHMMQAVETSLRRLQTDYIDVYMSHYDDPDTPVEETLRAYDDLIAQGKVRYIGASNFGAWRFARSLWASDKHDWARYEVLQPQYHLLNRDGFERELEAICRDESVAVIAAQALAAGFLTGKYKPDRELPSSGRAAMVQKGFMNERGFRVLSAVERVAADHGSTAAQVALAWIIGRPGMTAAIASATSVDQLKELAGATELTLSAEQRQALNEASEWKPAA
jgi:aryl-alcohol dehydrogenase-like predicted oxidoreductase